jgi:hypothetical protein
LSYAVIKFALALPDAECTHGGELQRRLSPPATPPDHGNDEGEVLCAR